MHRLRFWVIQERAIEHSRNENYVITFAKQERREREICMEMRQKAVRGVKKGIVLTMLTVLLTGMIAGCTPGKKERSTEVPDVLARTTDYLYEKVEHPSYGPIGGDWSMLVLTQSEKELGESYRAEYIQSIETVLKEKKGVLNSRKYTEYDRVILGLTALGEDVTDVAGYNLLKPLCDFKKICQQGINGPIWALIALDSKDYQLPENTKVSVQTTREKLIGYLLDRQLSDGGWTLSGQTADADLTAMAVQALSSYVKTDKKVAAAVDRAIEKMSAMQKTSGAFSAGGDENLESTAQVMLALLAMKIDPQKDSRFTKDGNNIYQAFVSFEKETGGFSHLKDDETNQMATEQAGCALTAYARFLEGKSFIYDMKDDKNDVSK